MRYRLRALLIVLALGPMFAVIVAPFLSDSPPAALIVLPTKSELRAKDSVHRRLIVRERHEQLMKLRRTGKSIQK
jgi:hypothetical protein